MRLQIVLVATLCCSTALAATGGPDAYGHTWIDSLDPAGPTFMAVDISTTGLLVGDGDDVGFPVTLATPFDFYGTPYTTLDMSTNGFLATQGGGGNDLSNDCPLPAPPSSGAGGRLYLLHDDLDCEPGIGRMYYQHFAACPRPADRGPNTGCSVFQWDAVSHYPGGGGATWDQWIMLYDSGDFIYQLGAGNPESGSSSTTAIMNPTYVDSMTVACNTPSSIPGDYVVHFKIPNFGPTCALVGPVGVAGGDISVDFTPTTVMAVAVDSAAFEFSTDGGVIYSPCTTAIGSPLSNPAMSVPSGSTDSFLWDSLADGVGISALGAGTLFRAIVLEGTVSGSCEIPIDVDNLPTCVATGPSVLARGDVTVDCTTVSPPGRPAFDLDFEFSVDAGVTYSPCSPAPTSALSNPAIGVPTGAATFVWDSRLDMVGLTSVITGVLVRVSADDGAVTVPSTCVTAPFDVDNTALCGGVCGDCNQNGVGPDIVDALVAAQISAGIFAPPLMQAACCDVNAPMLGGTPVVDIIDSLVIAQASAGLPVTPMCP